MTTVKRHGHGTIINLFGGPGTGKSTTAYLLAGMLKLNINAELVTEFAKDAAWEKRGHKVFAAQDYIFGKQNFRINRVADEVDYVVTDGPILLGLVYMHHYPHEQQLQSLRHTILEAHHKHRSVNVFLTRDPSRPYNPKGRNQTAKESLELDYEIYEMLIDNQIDHHVLQFEGVFTALQILALIGERDLAVSIAADFIIDRPYV